MTDKTIPQNEDPNIPKSFEEVIAKSLSGMQAKDVISMFPRTDKEDNPLLEMFSSELEDDGAPAPVFNIPGVSIAPMTNQEEVEEESPEPAALVAEMKEEASLEEKLLEHFPVGSVEGWRKLLKVYNLSLADAVIDLLPLVGQEEESIRKSLYEHELAQAGLKEEDINNYIKEFLYTGKASKTYSLYDKKIQFVLESPKAIHGEYLKLKMNSLFQLHRDSWTQELEAYYETVAKLTYMLKLYSGPSGVIDGPNVLMKDLEDRFSQILSLGNLEFTILTQAVSKFTTALYLASEKVSAENF